MIIETQLKNRLYKNGYENKFKSPAGTKQVVTPDFSPAKKEKSRKEET
jgi:hypothetical protein